MDVEIDSSFGMAEAFRVDRGDVVSIVGAGGKTTTLYGIASELRRRHRSVITTTTTNMQSPRYPTTMPPLVYANEEQDWLEAVRSKVEQYGSATVVGVAERDDKLRGLAPEQIGLLRELADCVVLEADGARGRSLKAPAPHEPVIPSVTTLTVIVAGLDALGMPLEDHVVHRLEQVLRVTGAAPGRPITEGTFARTLLSGYGDRIPDGSRRVFFINKVEDAVLKEAERIARALVSRGAEEVIFGQAREPHRCFYRVRPA